MTGGSFKSGRGNFLADQPTQECRQQPMEMLEVLTLADILNPNLTAIDWRWNKRKFQQMLDLFFSYSIVSASVKSNSTVYLHPPENFVLRQLDLGCLVNSFVFLGYYYLSFRAVAGLSSQGDLLVSLCRHDSHFTNTFPFSRVVGRFYQKKIILIVLGAPSGCPLAQPHSQESQTAGHVHGTLLWLVCSGNRAWWVTPGTVRGSQCCIGAAWYVPSPHVCRAPLGLELSNPSWILDCLVLSSLGLGTNFCTLALLVWSKFRAPCH